MSIRAKDAAKPVPVIVQETYRVGDLEVTRCKTADSDSISFNYLSAPFDKETAEQLRIFADFMAEVADG
jgi:hypothetical protein